MTSEVTWGQCFSQYATNIVFTPVSYMAAKATGLSQLVNAKNLMNFLKNEESFQQQVTSIPQKLWEGLTTSFKVSNLSIPTQEGVKAFFFHNRVALGVGAVWGFTHSVVDHVASKYFSNPFSVRSYTTYALAGVMLWGAAQAASWDLPAETMGNIALSALTFHLIGKVAYCASSGFHACKGMFSKAATTAPSSGKTDAPPPSEKETGESGEDKKNR